jgi:uncharacterized protein (DUF58 family)
VADRLSIGRQNQVALEIFNQSQTALEIKLKDTYPAQLRASISEFLFSLPAGSGCRLHYDLLPQRRGNYTFAAIHLAYLSRLGLFWRRVKVQAPQEVKVFSDLKALQELTVKLSHSLELGDQHQRRRGQGTQFSSLREYSVGDDVRSIDWKATARRDRPIIRTYESEQEQVLMILIDAGRMMVSDLGGLTRFDHALNAALCLALAGLTRNDQVGLGIFADRPLLYLPPRRGKAQMKRLIEAVFNLQPSLVEPDYLGNLAYFANAHKSRSLMVMLTDLTDPTGSQTLVTGMSSLAPRHLPFCVTLKDKQVQHLAEQKTKQISDAYNKAVASELISDRQLALSVLRKRGCLVLDCAPQDLSEQLVDRYLQIKARGSL